MNEPKLDLEKKGLCAADVRREAGQISIAGIESSSLSIRVFDPRRLGLWEVEKWI